MTDTQTSEWIEWKGGGMPVDGSQNVIVEFRDGMVIGPLPASSWLFDEELGCRDYWCHDPAYTSEDIVAYRVVKP